MKAQTILPLAIAALAVANADARIVSYTISGVTTHNIVNPGDITTEFPVGTNWSALLEWDSGFLPLSLTDKQSQYRLTKFKFTFQGVSGPWTTSSLPDIPSFTLNYPYSGTKQEIQFTSGWGPEVHTNPTIKNLQPFSINIILGDPTGAAITKLNSPPSSLALSDWSTLISDSYLKIYLSNDATQRIYGDIRSIKSNSKPEISVQNPLGSELVDGMNSRSYGTVATTSAGVSKTFTIKNTGNATLSGLAVSKLGINKGDFTVSPLPSTSLAPGKNLTFKVTFKPLGTGARTGEIRIASNDADENPFNVRLAGSGK